MGQRQNIVCIEREAVLRDVGYQQLGQGLILLELNYFNTYRYLIVRPKSDSLGIQGKSSRTSLSIGQRMSVDWARYRAL